jgi:ABC-2 type transport system permease protein
MENRRTLAESLRVIWAIAAKDIVDAIKNKTTISIIIGVAFLLLSGQAMPLLLKLQAIPRAYYFDVGESKLISDLAKNREFQLISMPSQEEVAKSVGESSGAVLGIIIPVDFDQKSRRRAEVELEGSFVHWAKFEDVEDAVAFFEEKISEYSDTPVAINIDGNAVYPAPDADGQPFMFTLSLVVATITIGAFLVPLLMVEEKEKHTMEALMVSPASYGQVVLGKTIAGIFYCLTAAAVVFAINSAMVSQWWVAILAILVGACFTVAVGLFVGMLFDHQGTMNLWLGLILLLLLMPVFLDQAMGDKLPEVIRVVVPWLPSVALSNLIRISLTNNIMLDQIGLNIGIIMAFAILILTAVAWRLRNLDR